MPATEFTPVASLLGGALIGLSAAMFLLTLGRIAGISGIVAKLLPPVNDKKGIPLSMAFIAGLLLGAPVLALLTGQHPEQSVVSNIWLVVIAGLLVGFGSILGNGCTSGHGVCGISRFSVRSLLATATFMFTGAVTVYLVRHGVSA